MNRDFNHIESVYWVFTQLCNDTCDHCYNMSGPIQLDDLAKAAGMSKYHFSRCFRKKAGLPPMQLLGQMRLDAARGLLMTTDLPLKAVARRVGIRDENYLSHLIHKRYGKKANELRGKGSGAAK